MSSKEVPHFRDFLFKAHVTGYPDPIILGQLLEEGVKLSISHPGAASQSA